MFPYQDPSLDTECRLDDLVGRMTLDELIMQTDQYNRNEFAIFGAEGGEPIGYDFEKLPELFRGMSVGSVGTWTMTPAQCNAVQRYAVEHTRLGIPMLFCEEALHGFSSPECTSFPQQIGLASTFEPSLGHAMGRAIAREARAKGFHEVFTPVIDLMRDPRFGRTEEAYGEDTFLGSQFARETVLGVQGDSLTAPDAVASQPKHYAAYGSPVAGLNCAPCAMSRHEVFSDSLPIFEAAIQEAGATDVMCSYTAVGGIPVSMDREMLTDVLRGQWGMQGFVRSDMTAISRLYDWFYITEDMEEAIRLSLEAGVDLQYFDMPHEVWQNGVKNLVESGRMDRSVVEQAARRMLRTKMRLGLFEKPYVDESLAEKVVHCEAHQDLAEKIARESIVLLKNKDSILPLSKELSTVAVIGPAADRAILGDYTPRGKTGVSVLEGIRRALPDAKILHEPGCGFLGDRETVIGSEYLRDESGAPGLTGRYYPSRVPEGESVLTRTDRQVSFNWTIFPPDGEIFTEKFSALGFSVVWTGTLCFPESFEGFLGFGGEDSVRIFVDGEIFLDCWGEKRFSDRLLPFSFEGDREYAIRIEYTNDQQGADVRFGYRKDVEDFSAAVDVAKQAQVAIVCVGDSTDTSGENFDRVDLDLPGRQSQLVKAIHATGTPVILVMQSGRPVACTWEQKHIPAILQCWFPGERGGYAIADTLFGDNAPSGRLPITFPRHVGQVPCHYTRRPGGGRRYIDMSWVPLYPFGYGLSYTKFEYRGLELSTDTVAPGDSISATVTVANVGDRPGKAVPQLYLRDWVSSTVKPERYMAGFTKVELQPGEEKTVSIQIDPKSMRTLGADYIWRVEPGKFTVYLGEDSEKLLFEKTFYVR